MGRRDLAWLGVFTDPFARLRRPVSDIKSSPRIILEDDVLLVPGCALDRLAHKNAYANGTIFWRIIGLSILHFQYGKPIPPAVRPQAPRSWETR